MPGGTSVCPNSMSVFKTIHLLREMGKTATSSSKPSGSEGCDVANLLVKIRMICRSPSVLPVIMCRSIVVSRSFKSKYWPRNDLVPRWLSLVDASRNREHPPRKRKGRNNAPQGRGFKPRPRLHTASAEHTVYEGELRISDYADASSSPDLTYGRGKQYCLDSRAFLPIETRHPDPRIKWTVMKIVGFEQANVDYRLCSSAGNRP